jgi:hypothetical protein
MSVDIDEPRLDLGDPVRVVGEFGFAQQRIALKIGLEYDLDQALRSIRRFLRETADAPARRDRDGAALDRQFAADRGKQRRFAGAVATNQTDAEP